MNSNSNNDNNAVVKAIKRRQKVMEQARKNVVKTSANAENAIVKANKAIDNAKKAANVLSKQMKGTLATRRSSRARKPSSEGAQYRKDVAVKKRKAAQLVRNKASRKKVNEEMNRNLLAMLKRIKV